MDEVESRLQIDGNHCVPLRLRHTQHQAVFSDTGIVYQNIYRAEILFHLLHHFFRLCKISRIGSVAFGLHAESGDFCLGSLPVFINYQIRKSHVRAFGGKLQGYGLADAAGGTRHQSRLSCQ